MPLKLKLGLMPSHSQFCGTGVIGITKKAAQNESCAQVKTHYKFDSVSNQQRITNVV